MGKTSQNRGAGNEQHDPEDIDALIERRLGARRSKLLRQRLRLAQKELELLYSEVPEAFVNGLGLSNESRDALARFFDAVKVKEPAKPEEQQKHQMKLRLLGRP